jgi:hypothetical protein
MFPKLGFQQGVERGTKGGMKGFRINCLWHDTIGLQKVYHHVPLAAITNKVAGEVTDETVFNREVRVLNRELEVVVGLIKFVPEE